MGDKINVFGITKESIVDGKGFRYALFVQGCPHKCKGCHNMDSWKMGAGTIMDTDEIFADFIKNPLLSGMTLSGGEPFMQAEKLIPLAKKVREMGKNIWTYSGFTIEEIMADCVPFANELLKVTDVLVDGKFILEQKNLELSFRGSENQRVIDVKEFMGNL